MTERRLGWPVPGPWVSRVTQGFGARPEVYRQFGLRGHNGLDFGVPVGTPVLASDEGVVTLVALDMAGFGLHLKIRHTWGYTLYAHLEVVRCGYGQKVRRGEVVARSGNSGFSSGPHLHFGVQPLPVMWRDGWRGYVDPLLWLEGGIITVANGQQKTIGDF